MSDKLPLDWTKLPDGMEYLAAPAAEYGRIQFGEQIDAFMESITDDQRVELAALADRLWKWSDDGHRLVGWLDEVSMSEHPEAARVYFLMNLLHELGLA